MNPITTLASAAPAATRCAVPKVAWWNAQKAAEYVGMARRTVLQKARRGEIPAHPRGRGKRRTWMFLESELFDWMMSQATKRDDI